MPTGGEIPVTMGLGVLLITLPVLCLPSMMMVARALYIRVTVITALIVAGDGLLAAGTLSALG